MDLPDVPASEGWCEFATLPHSVSWPRLTAHLATLPGVQFTDFVADLTEGFLDFEYKGQSFSVNDKFGKYWFFVRGSSAPDEVLRSLVEHCAQLLGK